MFMATDTSNSNNLATSAPADMGFEYRPFQQQQQQHQQNSNNDLAKSLEDEYTLHLK